MTPELADGARTTIGVLLLALVRAGAASFAVGVVSLGVGLLAA